MRQGYRRELALAVGLVISMSAPHAIANTTKVTLARSIKPEGHLGLHPVQFVTAGVLAFQDYEYPDFFNGRIRIVDVDSGAITTLPEFIGRNDFSVTSDGQFLYCDNLFGLARLHLATASGQTQSSVPLVNCNSFGLNWRAASVPGGDFIFPHYQDQNSVGGLVRVGADAAVKNQIGVDLSEYDVGASDFWGNQLGFVVQQRHKTVPNDLRLVLFKYGSNESNEFKSTHYFLTTSSPSGAFLVTQSNELVFLNSELDEVRRRSPFPYAAVIPYLDDGWLWTAKTGDVLTRFDLDGNQIATTQLTKTDYGLVTVQVLGDGRVVLQTSVRLPEDTEDGTCKYDISVLSPALVETHRWSVDCWDRAHPLPRIEGDAIVAHSLEGLLVFSTSGVELYRDETLKPEFGWRVTRRGAYDRQNLIAISAHRRTYDEDKGQYEYEDRVEVFQVDP